MYFVPLELCYGHFNTVIFERDYLLMVCLYSCIVRPLDLLSGIIYSKIDFEYDTEKKRVHLEMSQFYLK